MLQLLWFSLTLPIPRSLPSSLVLTPFVEVDTPSIGKSGDYDSHAISSLRILSSVRHFASWTKYQAVFHKAISLCDNRTGKHLATNYVRYSLGGGAGEGLESHEQNNVLLGGTP